MNSKPIGQNPLLCPQNSKIIKLSSSFQYKQQYKIYLITKMSNISFQYVSNAQLNNSRSKQAHQFGKARRFQTLKPSNCVQSSYDLSKTNMTSSMVTKPTILARDSRFKSSATISPSPDSYNRNSFVDFNRSVERGHSFSHGAKLVSRNKDHLYPGPGAHQPSYNPDKKLSYTMRSKIKPIDNKPKIGPGQYNIASYQAFSKPNQMSSKYSNPKMMVMGTANRFKNKQFETTSPGPFAHSRVKTEMTETKYSFGHVSKQPSYIRKNQNPGPGSYNKFSQFSELKFGGSNSNKGYSAHYSLHN